MKIRYCGRRYELGCFCAILFMFQISEHIGILRVNRYKSTPFILCNRLHEERHNKGNWSYGGIMLQTWICRISDGVWSMCRWNKIFVIREVGLKRGWFCIIEGISTALLTILLAAFLACDLARSLACGLTHNLAPNLARCLARDLARSLARILALSLST